MPDPLPDPFADPSAPPPLRAAPGPVPTTPAPPVLPLHSSPPPSVPAPPSARQPASGNTETPLDLPTLGRMITLFGRSLRLRCPHCGGGPVLEGWSPRKWARARERCRGCNFRFMRGAEGYFTGALFCNLLLAELVFAIGFLASVLLTWPDVPWDALTYGGAAVMVTLPAASYPVAMVLWLTMDVLVRPVTRDELS